MPQKKFLVPSAEVYGEEEPGEDTGAGCGLSGGVSQVRDLQSTITTWRKNLRSKHLPEMYPPFTGRRE